MVTVRPDELYRLKTGLWIMPDSRLDLAVGDRVTDGTGTYKVQSYTRPYNPQNPKRTYTLELDTYPPVTPIKRDECCGQTKSNLYEDTLDDINAAKEELRSMGMHSDSIIADFYCLPSQNQLAYYIALCREHNGYCIRYVTTEVIDPDYSERIRMYGFRECSRLAGNSSVSAKFIVGKKIVPRMTADYLLGLTERMPEHFSMDNEKVCLDGIRQGIRLFNGNETVKEVFYTDAGHMQGISAELAAELNSLHQDFEQVISYGVY